MPHEMIFGVGWSLFLAYRAILLIQLCQPQLQSLNLKNYNLIISALPKCY